ncbi:hypothetical protein LY76DRAFT_224396 [Colletotrichum caudatum]|nr:hypothetical protein LY76DRAFT_224396 [Colletotrichum caudatum]
MHDSPLQGPALAANLDHSACDPHSPINHQGKMAERSKALASGASQVIGVGSNPTLVNSRAPSEEFSFCSWCVLWMASIFRPRDSLGRLCGQDSAGRLIWSRKFGCAHGGRFLRCRGRGVCRS